jgi:signal transduction histidine kinase
VALETNLGALLDYIDAQGRRDLFKPADLEKGVSLRRQLIEAQDISEPEYRNPILQQLAVEVLLLLDVLRQGALPNDNGEVRDVQRAAEELNRMTSLVMLRRLHDKFIEVGAHVRNVRERVIVSSLMPEKLEVCVLWDLVMEAERGLSEYAAYNRLYFKNRDRSNGIHVYVDTSQIVRAITDLLSNAIKYSWLSKDKPGLITVTAYTDDRMVYVDIEDLGVPIPQDEIEKGLLFRLGFRGRLSQQQIQHGIRQQSRQGTGMGLYDARLTARQYGGDVTIQSQPPGDTPIRGRERPDTPSGPHIVTATLSLPLYSRSGKDGK